MNRFFLSLVLIIGVNMCTPRAFAQDTGNPQTDFVKEAKTKIQTLSSKPDDEMTAELHRELAQAYNDAQQPAQARKQYDAAVAKAPGDVENYLKRGRFLISESLDLSIKDFRKILELDPSNSKGLAALGAALAQQGDYAEAETLLSKAVQQNPNDSNTLANLAEVQRNLGQLGKANETIALAIKNAPKIWRYYFVSGLILQDLDSPAEAAASYTKAISLNPDLFGPYYNRGNCYRVLKDLPRARADYLKATEISPEDSDGFSSLGFTETRMGMIDQAIPHLRTAIKLNPKDADAWDSLGFCFDSQEEYSEAYAAYTKLIELRPDSASAYTARAQSSFYSDESEKTLADALAALKLQPSSGAHYYAGCSSYELRKWEAAVKHFSYLIDSGSEEDSDEIWKLRGECYQQLNKKELAAADRERADKINAPLHQDDLDLLDTIALQKSDEFIASLSPTLLAYIDRAAIPGRLSQVARHTDNIETAMRKSVQTHATLGRMETRIQFRDPSGEEADEVSMLILRDKKLRLLGIEVRGKEWSTTTLDALTGMDPITKKSQAFVEAIFKGDVQAAIKAGPKDSLRVDQFTELVKRSSQMIGGLQGVELQDVIITPPSRTGGTPMISLFLIAQKAGEELFLACELQFVIDAELTQAGLDFGDSVQANYVSQNSRPANRFAKACATGDLSRFADLFFDSYQSEVTEDKLQGVFFEALKESSGALIGVLPSSLSSEVTIGDQSMIRKVRFTAHFENFTLPIHFSDNFGHVDSYLFLTENSDFQWVQSEKLRDHWQPFATENLSTFAKGSPEGVLKMLQSYRGYDSLTLEKVANILKSFRDDIGEIQSIKRSGASFKKSTWEFLFEISGVKGKANGYVVFGQSNLERSLMSIGINPVKK